MNRRKSSADIRFGPILPADDVFATIYGWPEDDMLIGTDDDDIIDGRGGNDILDGRAGADTLLGGDGDDTLILTIDDLLLDGGVGDIDLATIDLFARGGGTVLDLSNPLVDQMVAGTMIRNVDRLRYFGSTGINQITGGGYSDRIEGNAADDILNGGGGNDVLIGRGGDDLYIVDSAGDVVIEAAGEGCDTISSSTSYTLAANSNVENLSTINETATDPIHLVGNGLDNRLTGNAGANALSGGAGDDILIGGRGNDLLAGEAGMDTMFGGDGDDTLILSGADVLIDGGYGIDLATIDLSASGGGTVLDLSNPLVDQMVAGTTIRNVERLRYFGSTGTNQVTGSALGDFIQGNGLGDILNGGGGADLLIGRGGNDLYIFDNAGDQAVEAPGQGIDIIYSAVSYSLGDSSEIENLSTISWQATDAIDLAGNALANTLIGNAGANALDGRGGADVMIGREGNDLYIVDSAADQAVEAPGQGIDIIYSAVSYGLGDGSEIENLSTTSWQATDAIDLAGNALANTLIGNAGANILDGRGGDDVMIGREGNDVYLVDTAGDLVIEAAGQGIDTIRAAASYALAAGSEIENLSAIALSATDAIDLTGNSFSNTLTGNAGVNHLDGGGGADVMIGLAGDDVYIVDHGGDLAIEAAGQGIDTVRSAISYALAANIENLLALIPQATDAIGLTGNGLDNMVTGNAGANALDGGAGADVMIGREGNDLYIFDSAGDQAVEAPGQGIDIIYSAVSYSLGDSSEIENLSTISWQATDAIDLTGNALANTLIGNAGVNVLNGGAGNDVLIGREGNDIYLIEGAGDLVIEAVGQGTDTIRSAMSYSLAANSEVENLSTIIPAATDTINLTGNSLSNTLTGNAGANALDGAAGNDVMIGREGNDLYIVDHAGDLVVEAAGQGIDIIYSAASYALAANSEVENLSTITWQLSDPIDLTGNALANTLIGNAGVNILDGGAGNDVMIGREGNDIYFADSAADQAIEVSAQGADIVYSAVSYALAANTSVENLSAINQDMTDAIDLTGNGLHNMLVGNAGINILDGRGGNDILFGREGNDIYFADSAADEVVEEQGHGTDIVYAAVSYALSGTDVENLSTINPNATDAIDLTGNDLDNMVVGNAGANQLDGGAGNDLMDGGAGNDLMIGGTGDDLLGGGTGIDSAEFADDALSYADTIAGWLIASSEGNDSLENVEIAVEGSGQRNLLVGATGFAAIQDALDAAQTGDNIRLAAGSYSGTVGYGVDGLTIIGQPGSQQTLTYATATGFGITIVGADLGDTITAGGGDDLILGGGGQDQLFGAGGDDSLAGDIGDDLLDGGAGIDSAAFAGDVASYADTIAGWLIASSEGSDSLANIEIAVEGNGQRNLLVGATGFATTQNASDAAQAGDNIRLAAGDHGGTVTYDVGGLTVIGQPGSHQAVTYATASGFGITVIGADLGDAIVTGDGNDRLFGGFGDDEVFAGGGDDLLDGGADIDNAYYAGPRGDYIVLLDYDSGGAFITDVIDNNAVNGDEGHDTLANIELAIFDDIPIRTADPAALFDGNDVLVDTFGTIQEALNAAGTGYTIRLAAGSYGGTVVYDEDGLRVLGQIGAVQNVTYATASGFGITVAGAGLDDTITTGDGDDHLDGKGGNDHLDGNGGADTFSFTALLGAGNADVILGFDAADDTIALDDAVFAGLTPGALNPNAFVVGTAAADADDRIIYDNTIGALYFDADGNGAGAAILFAVVAAAPALTVADFAVI